MQRKLHVRFLGEGATATSPPYPTRMGTRMLDRYGLTPFSVDFGPVPKDLATFPSVDFLQKRIAQSIIDLAIMRAPEGTEEDHPGIREVTITAAAFEQIRAFWWARRDRATPDTPPPVALKFYVFSYSQSPNKGKFVDVEIHPGIDSWES